MTARRYDLDRLADEIGSVTVPDLLECIGQAAFEMAACMRRGDQLSGVGHTSAFLNALEMLPADMIAECLRDRPGLAEHEHLRRLAL